MFDLRTGLVLATLPSIVGCAGDAGSERAAVPYETVSFSAADGMEVTADLYAGVDRSAPTVVLFHQSASSRGEYRRVAPRLARLGYNALAVDLRWGDRRDGVVNETAHRAGTPALMERVESGDASPWERIDASYLDMEAALAWLDDGGFGPEPTVVGSSFSAMLVYRLASEQAVSAVVAFSPGEYDGQRPELVRSWAGAVTVPTLSVAAVDEGDLVRPVHEAVGSGRAELLLAPVGRHGASILDEDDRNWSSFASFLGSVTGGPPAREEIVVEGPDGIGLVADRYDAPGDSAVVLLFHQGGGSARGEYGFLIPSLLEAGFDVVAADLWGGGDRFGPPNRTMARAPEPADFGYCDALPQLRAVLGDARAWRPDARVVLWGSSYSGALVLHAGATNAHGVDRVLAFSPAAGEPMAGCSADAVTEELDLPVLIVRPASEYEIPSVQERFARFEAAGLRTWVADPGAHGSSTLNPFRVEGDVTGTRAEVDAFLRPNGS